MGSFGWDRPSTSQDQRQERHFPSLLDHRLDLASNLKHRKFIPGMTLVGVAVGVYYWSILDTAAVIKEGDCFR